jgi:hypothetical protein
MHQRFLNDSQIISEILKNCNLLRTLQKQFPFIDCDNKDFVTLVNLFDEIVIQDYPDDSLIICIGDSPAKMCDIQSKMKSWPKNAKLFYFPVSKTVLHMPQKQFYQGMEDFDGEDWEDFFEPILYDNLEAPHVDRYISFLQQRGILDEFVSALAATRKIVFVDFIAYGNSFVGLFLYLFVPMLYKLDLSMENYTCEVVFLVDPYNKHHQIADALKFMLQTYFVRRRIIFIEDVLSPNSAQQLTDFFMESPARNIQQVVAPQYNYPQVFPEKNDYMPILLLMYANIILHPELRKLFTFFPDSR